MILGDLQGFVAMENPKLKQNDVKELIYNSFEAVDKQKWQTACDHVENEVEPMFCEKDSVQDETIIFFINFSSDSEGSI